MKFAKEPAPGHHFDTLRRYLVEVVGTSTLREEGEGAPPPTPPGGGEANASKGSFPDKVGDLVSEIDTLSQETKDPADLTKALKAGVLEGEFNETDLIDLINRISVRSEEYWKAVFERFMLFIR